MDVGDVGNDDVDDQLHVKDSSANTSPDARTDAGGVGGGGGGIAETVSFWR